ncbi:hypothetical protein [Parasphingorhabdus sp.]|uniref:hypothetical protein n=1 Tax=Parasphingorhabdus sp. TaxID=2709688 RepID=UPI003C732C10
MFDLFEPRDRRVKDEQAVHYYYTKYGDDAPAVLSDRASDHGLSSRDRRHWRRLARKARQRQSVWMDALKTN